MDYARSVYDHPTLRGLGGSILFVFALWAFFLDRQPDVYAGVLAPQALVDWIWLIGALCAAHLAGFVSGYLRTSKMWLAISVGLTPLYWTWLVGVCSGLGGEGCQSTTSAIVGVPLLAIGFLLPIILLSGFEFALSSRRKKTSKHMPSPWPGQRA